MWATNQQSHLSVELHDSAPTSAKPALDGDPAEGGAPDLFQQLPHLPNTGRYGAPDLFDTLVNCGQMWDTNGCYSFGTEEKCIDPHVPPPKTGGAPQGDTFNSLRRKGSSCRAR